MSAVEGEFRRAVHLGHSIEVSDTTLSGWKEKHLDTVARELLFYFPFGGNDFRNAKKLQGRIALHRKLYYDVANAGGTSLASLDSVKRAGYTTFYGGAQWSEVEVRLRSAAAMSMDNVYTFPERYPQIALPANGLISDSEEVSAHNLMVYLDGGEEIEWEKYARFLRKKIAYFRIKDDGLVPVTWAKAVQLWEESGGDPPRGFSNIMVNLPYGLLSQYVSIGSREKSGQTFRDFVFEQTVTNFEKMLGATLSDEMKGELKGKMVDEQLRRDLVFYSAYPDQLDANEPTGTPEACMYLNMAKCYRMLKEKYRFVPGYDFLVLKWLYGYKMSGANMKKLKQLDQSRKPLLDLVLGSVQDFSPRIVDAEEFEKIAMDIVFAVSEWESRAVVREVHDLISSCSWTYFGWDLPMFVSFLEKRRDLKIPKGYGEKLEGFLQGLRATGKSPLFLEALWNPFDDRLLGKAFRCIQGLERANISTENALEILLNFENNVRYLEAFPEEFSALSSDEKLLFLRRKNAPFPTGTVNSGLIRGNEQVLGINGILQGPLGKFLVLCKLVANIKNARVLPRLMLKMKEVQAFMGCRLPKDLVAMLFFYDFPLTQFEEMLADFKKERTALICIFGTNNSGAFPKASRERIDGALMKFVDFCLRRIRTSEATLIQEHFSGMVHHAQSGIVCNRPEPITSVMGLGPHAGTDHNFVPLSIGGSRERMACAGWRMGPSKHPIFDVHLVHTGDFYSSCASAELPAELPDEPELLTYLRELGNHHLAELGGNPEPEIPERFSGLKLEVDTWIRQLKFQFRLAYLELVTRKRFHLGPKEGAFALDPIGEDHFTYLKSDDRPQVKSTDLDQMIATKLEPKNSLTVPLVVHCIGSDRVDVDLEWQTVEEGVKWAVSARGIRLNVVFPEELMASPKQKIRALNWQIAWLKALVFQQRSGG